MMDIKIFELGLILILIGLSIAITGFILAIKRFKGKINGGGIILIGPIPLIFSGGNSKHAWKILILIMIVFLIAFLCFLFFSILA
jgi:uncharacterized membrane protein